MKSLNILSHSAQETIQIGKILADFLFPGDIIAFKGELGSGKTTLIKGITLGLNITEISSPSFVIINEYHGKFPVYHFDLYRIDENQFQDLGYEEYFYSSGISLIEWADKIGDLFEFFYLKVEINYYSSSEDFREINFSAFDRRAENILKEFSKSVDFSFRM